MYIVLRRGYILSSIGHCLIVLRGGAQEITIIRVHYSRWVGNKKRARKRTYMCQYKGQRKEKNLKRVSEFTGYNPY